METQNITLSLNKNLLRKAKHLAIERHTSLSSLLAQTLEELVAQQENYEHARRQHLEILERGFDLGTGGNITWTREKAHER